MAVLDVAKNRGAFWAKPCHFLYGSLVLFVLLATGSCSKDSIVPSLEVNKPIGLNKRQNIPISELQMDLQVYPPVLTPLSTGELTLANSTAATSFKTSVNAAKNGCVKEQVIMVHEFANSYYVPFVGNYTPPSCSFNRVTFNLSVQIQGRQYDRLGIMYFGSTEIWRTTTAEPTAQGVYWSYIKDMSQYLSLFKKKQTFIFELDNIYDSTYTGAFNTTLTATFFTSEDTIVPADAILTISEGNGASGKESVFSTSDSVSVALTIPKRTRKAVVSIAATGQQAEEFWYGNVPNSVANTFGAGFLYGDGPFREVQLYIDNQLVGVVWPFPIIFTGGIVPGFWRPIVGIDAFDLKEDEIDITPWLPFIADGKKHTFAIAIAGVDDSGKKASVSIGVNSYWLVTGKVFLWYDPVGSITTGSLIEYNAAAPKLTVTSTVGVDVNGTNQTLSFAVAASRQLSIVSDVTTASGTTRSTWRQSLSYYNTNNITNYGYNSTTIQQTTGTDKTSGGYARQISYPLYTFNYFVDTATELLIYGNITRGQNIQITGEPVFPTGLQSFDPVSNGYPSSQSSTLATTQNSTAIYFANATVGYTYGNTSQEMTFSGDLVGAISNATYGYPAQTDSTELYYRYVADINSVLVEDHESLLGVSTVHFTNAAPVAPKKSVALEIAVSPKKALGRGPGSASVGT